MNIVIAIDSFKGSITSQEAGEAVKQGYLSAVGKCDGIIDNEVYISPIADGGEGTTDALVQGMGGTLITSKVTGPLGDSVDATWGIIEDEDKKTAVIEMAAAAGITLLSSDKLNPLLTTTYGVGELIKLAIEHGCRHFIIGIGSSSTNDGGVGMLQALGYGFLDDKGEQIEKGALGLKNLVSIDDSHVYGELKNCTFKVACDVKNTLCGERGCSAVYGPQKGATDEMIKEMDRWLANYAKLSGGDMDYPGSGAAGGMGYAFKNFLNADLEPGIEIVIEETKLEEKIRDADIVVTGEGRLDSQTVMGKVPAGVAKLAKKYNKKVIAFCGCATDDAGICNEYGIDAYFPILRNVCSLDEALNKKNAINNLKLTAEQVFRLI